MNQQAIADMRKKYITPGDHVKSDYFALIKEMVARRNGFSPREAGYKTWQEEIDKVYSLVRDELINNQGLPGAPVSFGTSGWRGIIGKDLFLKSVSQVTMAIVGMYLDPDDELCRALGVDGPAEARARGCVVGHDNRFGGDLLAGRVCDVLTGSGFKVFYAGEATTGVLSAAVLELKAAFSINLTPSHNPLEYAGFKYNAADAGPALPILTDRITRKAREIMAAGLLPEFSPDPALVRPFNALDCWISLVRGGRQRHGLDYDRIISAFETAADLAVAVDCVHGASRVHIRPLFKQSASDRLILLREDNDPTFGGIAPEPSTANLRGVVAALQKRPEPLKLGVIIDPDGDRIRFTDGDQEIDMNRFGAMSYHFLHEIKKKNGLAAKSVATSNFANYLAEAFNEEVFEPRVGFKEFKPVLGKALVCFEESDGISVIGHTPEKDAYIGLILALDMILTLKKNLGAYLKELEDAYGRFFPARDGVTVDRTGDALRQALAALERYRPGGSIKIGGVEKRIARVISIDGRKIIMEDGGWIMIRPSGTEPKVRFYVEARTEEGKRAMFAAARDLLAETGLLGEDG